MKQAILITAYQDMPQLRRLVDWFDSDFELFIHLDKRCREDISWMNDLSNAHLYRKYAVEWGDYRHLKAIVLLMKEAYTHADLKYFHLITGSDYPVPPIAEFKSFCKEHRNDNYLEHFPLPHADWGSEGGMNRIQYWWLRPNAHRSTGSTLTRRLVNLQRRFGIKRGFKYFNDNLYGGGTYWSVSREAIKVAVEYFDKRPNYLRRFRHTSIAEEICLPTLWCNSGISFINDYKRYIDWGADGANPQVLTEKDYDNIVSSGALFARKMQSGSSDKLIAMLNDQ